MLDFILSPAFAQAAAPATPPNALVQFAPLVVLFVLFYVVVAAVATFILRGLGLDPSSGWAILVYIVSLFGCFYAVERITKTKF